MDSKTQQMIAYILIGVGGLFFATNVFGVDAGELVFPILLVVAGFLLVFRPQVFRPTGSRKFSFAGDYRIGRNWTPKDEEYLMFAGDFDIDLREVDLPDGETHFRVVAFANDIDLTVPEGVGVSISAAGFVAEVALDGQKESHIPGIFNYTTEGYAEATKKLRLESNGFVNEVDLKIV